MRTNFQMIMEQKQYRPANRMFTSNEEIAMLTEHFGLKQMSDLELQNLRDMVVLLFTKWEEQENDYGYIKAMQSITAVIDYEKVHRPEVEI